MAQLYGKSSEYLLSQKLKNKYKALWVASWIFVSVAVYWLVIAYYRATWNSVILGTILLIVVNIVLHTIGGVFIRHAYKYKKGIRGENYVLQELLKLPDTYMIFRNIYIPHNFGNIDFIVLGPSGAYILETKYVNGLIDFDGNDLLCNGNLLEGKHVVAQVEKQFWDLHNYLKNTINEDIFISPIIVFVYGNLKEHFEYAPIKKTIRIIDHRTIYKFFTSITHLDPKYPYLQVKRQLEKISTEHSN